MGRNVDLFLESPVLRRNPCAAHGNNRRVYCDPLLVGGAVGRVWVMPQDSWNTFNWDISAFFPLQCLFCEMTPSLTLKMSIFFPSRFLGASSSCFRLSQASTKSLYVSCLNWVWSARECSSVGIWFVDQRASGQGLDVTWWAANGTKLPEAGWAPRGAFLLPCSLGC